MTRYPSIWTVDRFIEMSAIVSKQVNGKWVPARPVSYQYFFFEGLATRLKAAWLVFTGKADALMWEGQ